MTVLSWPTVIRRIRIRVLEFPRCREAQRLLWRLDSDVLHRIGGDLGPDDAFDGVQQGRMGEQPEDRRCQADRRLGGNAGPVGHIDKSCQQD